MPNDPRRAHRSPHRPPHPGHATRRPRALVAGACLVALSATAALASGSRSDPIPNPVPQGPTFTPQQQAALAYEEGVQSRDKAWEFEAVAAEASSDAERDKARKQAQKRYARAQKSFQRATSLDPRLFQAWAGLGYSLRKLGQYDEALASYDRALQLEPGYTPAIEYRAEAYLELGRFAEVEEAYLILFRHDRPLADQLMATIDRWHAAPVVVVEPSADDQASFLDWVEERRTVAAQTPVVGDMATRKW